MNNKLVRNTYSSLGKLFLILILLCNSNSFGQNSEKHNLRGNYFEHRANWDLTEYELSVAFNFEKKEISGSNKISFAILDSKDSVFQIDLQAPMHLDSVLFNGRKLTFRAAENAVNVYFVEVPKNTSYFTVYFHGSPRVAKNPPWDGGIVWEKDKNGKPWATIACQGLGASVWFPCKDSQFDEPQSVKMHYSIPNGLTCISNGNFLGSKKENEATTWSWEVKNPINNYCMIPYIGDYVTVSKSIQGEKGLLNYSYSVLKGNEAKAAAQFKDIERTITAFEHWFGPYPFYEDGYKLVEAPHLGMEHQSAIAYGNGFQNGYLGKDLSGTGEGLKFDFIIVHESGHEWFGNNITSKDVADMWIHESFTCYSETLFLEYYYGKEVADRYCKGIRKNIRNDSPIIGNYWLQEEGSGDMYYKGANMLHTIRTVVGNDSLFRETLRKMNREFYHQTVTTEQIESFMSHELKSDLSSLFEQYLRTTEIPTMEIRCTKKGAYFKLSNCVEGLELPYTIGFNVSIEVSENEVFVPIDKLIDVNPELNYYINYSLTKTKGFKRKIKS